MLFRKYQIVVFKEDEGISKKFQLRGWAFLCLFFILAGLAASSGYLWQKTLCLNNTEQRLASAEQQNQQQQTQMLALSSKLKRLQDGLSRIRDFDSRLRVMVNLDQNKKVSDASLGGPAPAFEDNYLPMHKQELLARKMHGFLNQLNTEVRLEEVRQQQLMQAIRKNKDLWAATPSIWPTQGWISSPFGARTSPFTTAREFHKGIDISAPIGTPIYATARGTVTLARREGGYGLCLMVDHGAGIKTRYAHMHSFVVKRGQKVSRGELIGYVGSTGRSTGPHLHYEVRLNGVPVNPMRYVLN
ncbi:M23 family metallopeptidase [Desulfobaculum bizertense]|uniref:Murein DD-endopeptidase MepM and murein hydrolase activator NlpD, contain LysM domain n=1 Tax=Desulfobaculum bizertense DSM 18034 TaxID=1121442 RepID=A0A1T4W6S7_9BACT|nr:M23 family metallopeptidase [Desulfobaculum bizertense]UIJ39092.1 M23 family metallopeptidase [Desulfobaculum bizertense]SKA73034.1 Murein DD-endopeptidase MepM and murein hydrolase activator NlpD, contain LysM domain [Desulfobaculum bizertense DSM 18034]